MARYLVTQRSFIGGTVVEPGEEVEHEGPAGPNLRLLGDARTADQAIRKGLLAEAHGLGLAPAEAADVDTLRAAIGEVRVALE